MAGVGGSVIRHAAPDAVGALPVAVVETPFGTVLMAGPGGLNGPATPGRPARRRAIDVTAVTRGADGEEPVAVTAGLLSERLVHGVGAHGRSPTGHKPEPWHNSRDQLGLSEPETVTRVRWCNRALTRV